MKPHTVRLILALIVAVAAQVAAITAFFGLSTSEVTLFAIAGWQMLAAVSSGLFFANLVWQRGSAYCYGVFWHAVSVCLFLPVLGQVLFAVGLLASMLFGNSRRMGDFERLKMPEAAVRGAPATMPPGAAYLRSCLADYHLPLQQRLAAMVALRSLPPRLVSDVLRERMSDPVEEVRLLAYGIANSAETALNLQIQKAAELLYEADTDTARIDFNRRLATLHWELVYQGLLQGELQEYALQQAQKYALAALQIDSTVASMWHLLGRCRLFVHDADAAEKYLTQAEACGFPSVRLLPLFAEVAYLKREYGRIPRLVHPLRVRPLHGVVQPIVQYWTACNPN